MRVKRVTKSSFIATISLIKFEITLKLCIRESFHYDKDVSKILDCLSISDTIFCKLAINSGTFECQVSWSGIPTRLSLNLEDFSEVKALQIWPFSHFHDGWMMEKSCWYSLILFSSSIWSSSPGKIGLDSPWLTMSLL